MANVVISENIKHMPIYKKTAYRIDAAEGGDIVGMRRFYGADDLQSAINVLRNVDPRPKLVRLYEHQSLNNWATDELCGFLDAITSDPLHIFMLSDSLLPENGRMVLDLEDLHPNSGSGISAKITIDEKGATIPVWTIPYEKDNVGLYYNSKGVLKLPVINRGGRVAWQITKEQVNDYLGLSKEHTETWLKIWQVVNRVMQSNFSYDEAYAIRRDTTAFFQGGSLGPEQGFILIEFAGTRDVGNFLNYLGKKLSEVIR
jgi:hypothetical protein